MGARILAALVGLAGLLPALLFGGEIAVEIIVGIAILIGLYEFANMAVPEAKARALALMVVPGAALFAAVLYGPPISVSAVVVLSVLWLMMGVLFRPGPVEGAADEAGRLVLGVAYVAGLCVFIPLIRRMDFGLEYIFLLMAVTWGGDSGAYFAGRALGKHKLYEKISPKKTWEGAIGGVVAAVIAAFVVRAVALPDLTVVDCIILGVLLDSFGIIGDLVESMLKRSFGVKDSGNIMPGHGGILDRIDALMFTAPLLYLYLALLKG